MNSEGLSVSLISGLSKIKALVAPTKAKVEALQKQVYALKHQLSIERAKNLELQTRMECNAANFRRLLNTAYLLGRLKQLDLERYIGLIKLAQSSWVEPTETFPVGSEDLSVGEVREFLKSQPVPLLRPDATQSL